MKADSERIWTDARDTVERYGKVLAAGGEFVSRLIASQEQERGTPDEGYARKPVLGLRLETGDGEALTLRPGWKKPWQSIRDAEPVDDPAEIVEGSFGRRWVRVDHPGHLLLDKVQLELVNPGKLLALTISEDGVKIYGSISVDSPTNAARIKRVAVQLDKLLRNPMKTFASQADRCCCCGKTLTDVTSGLRGIGPECIRYFIHVNELAEEVSTKHEYRSLDAEWMAEGSLSC